MADSLSVFECLECRIQIAHLLRPQWYITCLLLLLFCRIRALTSISSLTTTRLCTSDSPVRRSRRCSHPCGTRSCRRGRSRNHKEDSRDLPRTLQLMSYQRAQGPRSEGPDTCVDVAFSGPEALRRGLLLKSFLACSTRQAFAVALSMPSHQPHHREVRHGMGRPGG